MQRLLTWSGLGLGGVLLLCSGCANGAPGYAGGYEDGGGLDATSISTNLPEDSGTAPGLDSSTGATGGDSSVTGLDSSTGATGGDSSTGSQPCVHNSDCTTGITDLCTGNNGVACLGGFCVSTGKPMVCNDGVPCVSGTCDANTNACVYTPNDSACQTGTYCDATKGCVAQLSCTPGDSVCDRLDLSVCQGLWSCTGGEDAGGSGTYCVQAPPPCTSLPNATTLCDGATLDAGVGDAGVTGTAACSWECESGYVVPTWNGTTWVQTTTLTPPAPATGCSCQITSAVDVPGYTGSASGFVDTNCDGIVGTIANAIFVSPSGSDSNPGTLAQPKRTLTAAISTAHSVGKDVYADKGTYNESITLASGVNLYGGYDSTNEWSRSLSNVSLIQGVTSVAVTVNGATAATTLQFFTITSQGGGVQTGGSSTAIQIIGSAGPLLVQGCTIDPGPGGSGIVPSAAITGANGGNASGQSAGTSSCSANGGGGGGAVSGQVAGTSGTPGSGAAGGAAGGGGNNGSGCCCLSGCSDGTTGGNGTPGGNGGNGADSSTFAPTIGTLQSTGNYVPASGIAGTPGSAGSGGGGAGSGGAAASGCTGPFGIAIGDDGTCHNDTSGWGGGGGGGGCAGGAGGGGGGGGGSFGVVIVGSTVTIDQCKINAASGGNAAAGGAGASGGTSGTGAAGVGGDEYTGPGGTGGNGGTGGKGGNGSGGSGGPSFCVYYSGTSPPTYTGNTCTRAGGGAGGAGGGGLSPAGYRGLDAEVQGS